MIVVVSGWLLVKILKKRRVGGREMKKTSKK
jgi:hypothetical protein